VLFRGRPTKPPPPLGNGAWSHRRCARTSARAGPAAWRVDSGERPDDDGRDSSQLLDPHRQTSDPAATKETPPPPPRCGRRRLGSDARSVQRDAVGAGTPSWRQMPRAVGGLISLWRGTVVRWPVAVLRQTSWLAAWRARGATVGAKVAFEIALLHAAISTDSTRAHPVAGMESPRSRRSWSTSSIASRTMTRASSSPSPCVCTSGSSGTCAYTQPSPACSKTTLKVSAHTSRTVALLWT